MKVASPNVGSLIVAFVSGACTTGSGIVVDTDRQNMIRGHIDISNSTQTATYYSNSCDFYDELKQRIVSQGHALNCFVASLDQVGIAEMKNCILSSGGVVLNA
uniref:Protein transport protein SEC23 n=1 Tax=Lygus hesperus TaxID=30085 RepID=A0A0A9YG84_LYGHE